MNLDDFRRTISSSEEQPARASAALLALWWDRKGDWAKAHDLVANAQGPDAAWVHAYLHHKEGDLGNARYWYSRAGKPIASGDLASEWDTIAATLLGRETTPEP